MTRRAFTLVEVLVTVAIVAILVAILLPGMRAAHGAARTTACSSNLRQIASACSSYEASNGALPAAVLYFRDGGTVRTVAWDFAQQGGTWAPGPLLVYGDAPSAVQQCPDYEGPSNFGADPYTGYNYNTSYLGHEGSYPTIDASGAPIDGWLTVRPGKPSCAVRSPSATAVFGDGGWRGGANKFMRAPLAAECDPAMACAGTQAFRHWGGCSCAAHLDGHVEVHLEPRRGPRMTDQLARWVADFPNNGFLSEGDAAYGSD
ncbi:MAG: prepilin-type N-terminal cleavage/methylation domain-containing protein [Actinobacteria bacterium]|nr:prepilin-type N-terminal cleavage/methylation domain-containing protein [Actinomycetota bacterium]